MKVFMISAALLISATAHAGAPATEASIRELFVLTKFDREISDRLSSLREFMKADAAIKASKITIESGIVWDDAAQRSLRDQTGSKVAAVFDAGISVESMTTEMVRVYARTYTEEEVKAQIAFYSSPVGRKVVATGQSLAGQVTDIAKARLPAIEPQIAQMLDGVRNQARELKAKQAPTKK